MNPSRRFLESPPKIGGMDRRKLNVDRAQKESGFRSSISFRGGLRETIRWYEEVAAVAGAGREAAS
jgi:nucleoside-diphosphate-sugar epimerase